MCGFFDLPIQGDTIMVRVGVRVTTRVKAESILCIASMKLIHCYPNYQISTRALIIFGYLIVTKYLSLVALGLSTNAVCFIVINIPSCM